MSKQTGFRFKTIEDKAFVTNVINKLADRLKGSRGKDFKKGDALVELCRIFESDSSTIIFNELPATIQETINLCDCKFVQWSALTGFVCYESYHKDKKTKLIGGEHKRVVSACALCKVGKAKSIQEKIEADFRKKGVNSFVKLINDLIRIDHEGAVAHIFFCQARRFTDDELYLSPDCVHFKCPEMDDELVVIDDHCLKQTNPFTLERPCRYLVAPFLRVPIHIPKETQVIMDEVRELEVQQEPTGPKEVEATIIEAEPEIITPAIEGIEETEPTNARDIIAKENREKEQAKLNGKEEGSESEP